MTEGIVVSSDCPRRSTTADAHYRCLQSAPTWSSIDGANLE